MKKIRKNNQENTYHEKDLDRIAIIITIIFVVFLIILGWKYGSAEEPRDVAAIRNGRLPQNVFHPLLYPILAGVTSILLHDILAGTQVVSSLMAGVFVFTTYLLGAKVVNKTVGLLCLLFTITNLHVIVFGVFPSTDMTGAAFIILTLFLCVYLITKKNAQAVILLGLAFSLAYFTRYQAMLLLPTILLALFFSSKASLKRFAIHLLVFLLSVGIFLSPHFVLTMKIFGRPFYDENWKNVAAKLYYDRSQQHHETYLDKVPFDGLTETIMHSPETFIKSGIQELWLFLRFGVNNVVGLPPLLAGLFFIGGYLSLFSFSKEKLIAFSFGSVYVFVIAFMFFASYARLLLPILPVCYLIIAEFLLSLDSTVQLKTYRIRPIMILVILIILAKTAVIIPNLRAFVAAAQ